MFIEGNTFWRMLLKIKKAKKIQRAKNETDTVVKSLGLFSVDWTGRWWSVKEKTAEVQQSFPTTHKPELQNVGTEGQEAATLSLTHGSGLLTEHPLNEISAHPQSKLDESRVSRSVHTTQKKTKRTSL